MSKPIKRGDLVMVVHGMPCCRHETGAEGIPFVATSIERLNKTQCDYCGFISIGDVIVHGFPNRDGIDISRLIRIDPPALSEDTPAEKELAI